MVFMSKSTKQQSWLNVVNLVFGIFSIIFISLALLLPTISTQLRAAFVAISLLFLSILRAILGITELKIDKKTRILNIVAGGSGIFISLISLLEPILSSHIMTNLLSIYLFLFGLIRIVYSIVNKIYINKYRILTLLIGIISLILSIGVFACSNIEVITLLYLIGFGYLVSSIMRISRFFIGKEIYKPIKISKILDEENGKENK
ncbi:MAG: hypothetical protein GF364_18895 [Candidatus Lokiarchaeota archaeon]|nr:hypothetical protein [Candidatus Lokiarchaeota archaeon]